MKFHVVAHVTITVTTQVEAPDPITAGEIASERSTSGNWRDDGNLLEEWVHDSLDGDPVILEIRAVD